MRAIFISILLLVTSSTNVRPDNFSAIPRMLTENNGQLEYYSAVIHKQDEENYYILTCAHALFKKNNPTTYANLMATNEESSVAYVALKCKLLKRNDKKDLALYSCKRPYFTRLTPIILGSATLLKNSPCEVRGYSNSNKLKTIQLTVNEYNATIDSEPTLIANGIISDGMSGGPLVKNDEVYGIQSSTGTQTSLLSNLVSIEEFLNERSR